LSSISSDDAGCETAVVDRATVMSLTRYLNPIIPWIWIVDHMPNSKIQWWKAQVPLNGEGAILSGEVRLVQYDLQLSTREFLLVANAFDDSGITLIQSRQRMPNTLDLRGTGSNRHQVLRLNGAFLTIDLPHAREATVVCCYECGYLRSLSET
jgi:hypothetical protein